MTRTGISVIPCADSLERIRELVRVADQGGLPGTSTDAASGEGGPLIARRLSMAW